MPYRRLPNTDSARLKALHAARKKSKELPPFKLAFSQGLAQRIENILPSLETQLSEHRNVYGLQLERSKEFNRLEKKAKMYISHFIQVVNMAIQRGDLPLTTRDFFGLDPDEKKLPSLSTDEEILEWGKRLIEGEHQRRMKGLTPVMNPGIALVKVHFDKFSEAYNFQDSIKKRYATAVSQVNSRRDETDQVIQQLWNEIENTFKDLPEDMRRSKAADYGVVYVYRKNELSGIDLSRAASLNIS